MTPDALLWLTVGPYVAAALVALVADAFGKTESPAGIVGPTALLLAGGIVGTVGGWVGRATVVHDVLISGGGYSTAAGLVGILAAVSVMALADEGPKRRDQRAALIALAATGYALAAASSDLLVLLLSLEIASVSSYAVTASGHTRGARQVALRYFVMSAVATGLALMGLVVMSGLSGTATGYAALSAALADLTPAGPVIGAVVLVVAALLLKLGAAPLHFWAPDVYDAAPPPAAGFLAGAGKLGTGMALANFVVLALPAAASDPFRENSPSSVVIAVLLGSALLSLVLGSLGALVQGRFTRMLGYAGITQTGYVLIAIAAFNQTAALVFLTTYALATSASFLGAQAMRSSCAEWDGSIAALGRFGRGQGASAAGLTVAMVSLSGLPPLVGFWGKFEVFSAGISAALATFVRGPQWAYAAYFGSVAFGLLAALISVAYYGSVIRALFSGESPSEEVTRTSSVSSRLVLVLGLLLLVLTIVPALVGFGSALTGFSFGL